LDALNLFEPAVTFGERPPSGGPPALTGARLFPMPPPMVACAVSPLFLDTALGELAPRSVAHRAPAAPASRLGRLGASLWKAGGYLAGGKS
jgi:hypothetical protein